MTLQAAVPDEGDIRRLVQVFYERVRRDALLGPVFAGVLGDDETWARHVSRLCDFWSSVMLTSGRYHGDPFSAHMGLSAVSPGMFDHWMAVFEETCAERFASALAAAFCAKARRISSSLRMGLFGRLPPLRRASPAVREPSEVGHEGTT